MIITRRMDCQGLVTTEISGRIRMSDILNSVLELGELTAYSRQLWEIIVLDRSVDVERDVHTSLEVAHNAKEVVQFKARGAIAIVAMNRRALDLSDRVARLLRGDVVPVTVFQDESQARRWLSIHMNEARIDATTVRRPRDLDARTVRHRA